MGNPTLATQIQRRTFLKGSLLSTAVLRAQPGTGRYPEPLGWKPHWLRQGDGRGGWKLIPAEFRFVHRIPGRYVFPFGITYMDNGELMLVASWHDGLTNDARKSEKPVVAFSRDFGDTWTDFQVVEGGAGRPVGLTDLGNGKLFFQTDLTGTIQQYFTSDYGRTWPERRPLQPATNGQQFNLEGNLLVERDAAGGTRVGAIGYNYPKNAKVLVDPADGTLRWSKDGGRTWANESVPGVWKWDDEANGKKYRRGVSEGALVRAANGWLIAALRTDLPARYMPYKHEDSVEGTAVSISKDDGRTWSPMKFIFEAGRHHAHLIRLKNGTLVMTVIVRDDVANGKLASYRRGCEAVLSRDHGQTWEVARRYVLDDFEFFDGANWYNGETGHLSSALLPDGRIVTVYGKYLTKGVNMIRWKPV